MQRNTGNGVWTLADKMPNIEQHGTPPHWIRPKMPKQGGQIMPKKQPVWLHPKLLERSKNLTNAYVKTFGPWSTQDSILKLVRHAAKIDISDTSCTQREDIAQVILISLMMFDRLGMHSNAINRIMNDALDHAGQRYQDRSSAFKS